MAKITIFIEGVAMFYLPADETWRVIFPFDVNDCHKVRYEYGNEKRDLAGAKRTINITVSKPVAMKSSKGSEFDRFFNLTENGSKYKAHTNGIKVNTNWDDHSVLLKIPNAVMSMYEETKSRYQLKNGVTTDLGKIGYSAKAEIEIERNGSVTIEVSGEGGFSKTFNYADGNQKITFNNDCDQDPTTSDLELLYKFIIKDKVNSGKKFKVDRHPQDVPPDGEKAHRSHNPSPNERGLPCYGVTVEETTGLPM